MASLIQYVMPGNPIIYYGTEVGLTGYKDPWNRKPYPWDNVNEDMLEHYSRLGRLRKKNEDILRDGSLDFYVDSKKAVIRRKKDDEEIEVSIYRDKTMKECKASKLVEIKIV